MGARYGHAWASQYTSEDEDVSRLLYAEWTSTLAGLTDDDIARGLAADVLRGERWPPSAPEFAALCRGVPSLAAVQFAMRKERLETPFMRLVWQKLDAFQYRRASRGDAARLVAEAYELAREHTMRGLPMPTVPTGELEHKPDPKTPAREETVRAAFAEMQAATGALDPATDSAEPSP